VCARARALVPYICTGLNTGIHIYCSENLKAHKIDKVEDLNRLECDAKQFGRPMPTFLVNTSLLSSDTSYNMAAGASETVTLTAPDHSPSGIVSFGQ
jgi:hypothetical protein